MKTTAHRFSLIAALAVFATSMAVAATAPGPQAVMDQFLKAMRQEDKEKIKAAFDWPALAEASFPDFKKQPEERQKSLMAQVQVIFVSVFSMGKEANDMKIGKVTTKGNEATAKLLKKDPKTGKMAPTSEFKLHKVGGKWLIYSVARAETEADSSKKASQPAASH